MDLPSWIRPIVIPTPFSIGPVNSWLILREPVTLIDAGPETPEAFAALDEALRREGTSVPALSNLFLTHGHHDHFGAGAGLARRNPKLVVHGSPADSRHFRKRREHDALRARLTASGVPEAVREEIVRSIDGVDRFASPIETLEPVRGGEAFAGDGWSLEVVSTPGHTPGSLCFRIAAPDLPVPLLATGDTVLHRITPNAVIDMDPDDPEKVWSSLTHYLATLDRLATMPGALLLPGHGRTIDDYPAHLERHLHLQGLRRNQVLGHLAKGPLTAWELVRRMFPDVSRLEFFLAYSEVVGNLLWLEERGELVRSAESGVERFARREPAA